MRFLFLKKVSWFQPFFVLQGFLSLFEKNNNNEITRCVRVFFRQTAGDKIVPRNLTRKAMNNYYWILLRILLSNDIESNPGPRSKHARSESQPPNNQALSAAQNRKFDLLERHLSRLERELLSTKRIGKACLFSNVFAKKTAFSHNFAVERQSLQIENLVESSRRKSQFEEEIMRLQDDVVVLKETASIQPAIAKRHQSELATFEYDLTALKKMVSQLKSDFKHSTNINLNELKVIKDQCQQNQDRLQDEQASKIGLKNTVWSLDKTLKMFVEGQKENYADVKTDLKNMQDFQQHQLSLLKLSLDELGQDLNDFKDQDVAQIRSDLEEQRAELADQSKKLLQTNMSEVEAKFKSKLKEMTASRDAINKELLEKVEQKILDVFEEKFQESELIFETKMTENSSKSSEQTLKVAKEFVSKKLQEVDSNLKDFTENYVNDQLDKNANVIDQKLEFSRKDLSQNTAKEIQLGLGLVNKEMKCQRDVIVGQLDEVAQEADEEKSRLTQIARLVSDRMDELDAMYEDMQDRVFEIDKNRKNNLVFYGVKPHLVVGNQTVVDPDDQDECEAIIKHLFSTQMQVTREIPLTKVVRLWNGPSFRGSKPILVCFHLYKDKEEILRKNASLLKGTNIYVTEDFSRKVRKHREELLKFARALRAKNESLRFSVQYDRLYVENDIYLYNEVEERVEKIKMTVPKGKTARTVVRKSNLVRKKVSHYFCSFLQPTTLTRTNY